MDFSSIVPDILAGGFGMAAQKAMNEANAREAQKNRDFQERMSNTAVRRSVEDYRQAGLNVGLAYDRSASTPGGAQAQMGLVDPVASAKSSSEFRQRMEFERQANERATKLNDATVSKLEAEKDLTKQTAEFNAINQPFERAYKSATAALQGYLLPAARNEATWAEMTKLLNPATSSARGLSGAISDLFPKFQFGTPKGRDNTTRHYLMPKGQTP